MPNPLEPFIDALDLTFVADRMLATLIRGLLQSGFTLAARPLVRIVRHSRNDDPVKGESWSRRKPEQPIGPFRLADPDQACDMLIFVPRSLESYLIDDATGGHGYSHVAVDCGEVDAATGRRVMVEATPRAGVHHSYLDKYGRREFIRLPLARTGVDCTQFRECILTKLGEPYDIAEVLTWGEVDDPAKQVCSDLAADCLPSQVRAAIVQQARSGRLGRRTVSIHGPASVPLHIFVSPNGFARFFGAPKGHEIRHPDELVEPRIRDGGVSLSPVLLGAALGIGAAAGLWIVWRLLDLKHGAD